MLGEFSGSAIGLMCENPPEVHGACWTCSFLFVGEQEAGGISTPARCSLHSRGIDAFKYRFDIPIDGGHGTPPLGVFSFMSVSKSVPDLF